MVGSGSAPRSGHRGARPWTCFSGIGCCSKNSHIISVASISMVPGPWYASWPGVRVSPGQTCPAPCARMSITSASAGQLYSMCSTAVAIMVASGSGSPVSVGNVSVIAPTPPSNNRSGSAVPWNASQLSSEEWSPQQISGRPAETYPGEQALRVLPSRPTGASSSWRVGPPTSPCSPRWSHVATLAASGPTPISTRSRSAKRTSRRVPAAIDPIPADGSAPMTRTVTLTQRIAGWTSGAARGTMRPRRVSWPGGPGLAAWASSAGS